MIAVINYGMGNLRSVQKAFERIGSPIQITSSIPEIMKAEKLVLPGVGHFANGMKNLRDMGLQDALNEKVISQKVPILGICLGMQLFTGFSEEGNVAGLGWIKATTRKFVFTDGSLKIPHMGWNTVIPVKDSFLLTGCSPEDHYYFVHSYYVDCENQSDIMLKTHYGITFTSSFQSGNIFGTQFHPEKSHRPGLNLLKNFINY
jgi:imidazole glycerol-phosphate synthase subunit HisH